MDIKAAPFSDLWALKQALDWEFSALMQVDNSTEANDRLYLVSAIQIKVSRELRQRIFSIPAEGASWRLDERDDTDREYDITPAPAGTEPAETRASA